MKKIGIEPVDFSSLVRRIWRRQELDAKKLEKQHHDAWRISVDENVRRHAKMLCYVEGTLTLSVAHSTASHQIRFMQKGIIAGLKKARCFKDLKKIAVVIIPEAIEVKSTSRTNNDEKKKDSPKLPESAVSGLKSLIVDEKEDPLSRVIKEIISRESKKK